MGIVYLINIDGTNQYKIGMTSRNIETRFQELKTGNPNLILKETYSSENFAKIETILHRQFKFKKIEGEWFQLDEDTANNFIAECDKINSRIELLKDNYFFK